MELNRCSIRAERVDEVGHVTGSVGKPIDPTAFEVLKRAVRWLGEFMRCYG